MQKTASVALFPGQGAQHPGMMKELLETFSLAREVFEEASDSISFDLKKLALDGLDSELAKTENTQPVLLAASIAAFRVAEKEIGFKPAVAAGHSLGEYSALVAANAIPLKTATQWVRERGAAMQKAVPLGEGTMAAVLGLDDSRVEALCKKAQELSSSVVEPANFNSPGQVVIAGATPGIQKAIELAKTDSDFKGAKAMALAVSAPFHCSLMKPAREHMAAVFQKAKPSPLSSPLFPYVPNRTARMHQEKGVILELLIDQIDHPVLWKQSIEHLLQEGFRNAIEFGPGKVLQGLMKRISLSDGSVMRGISMNESSHLKIIEEALR